jgi:hypothetical protein
MTTLLYTAKPCGCLVTVLVNNARNLRDFAQEIASEARAGRTLHETTKEKLPPFSCDEHRETRYGWSKPVAPPPDLGL